MTLKIGDRIGYVAPVKLPAPQSDQRSRRWCPVATLAYRESEAERRIKDLGYLTYVPRFKTKIRDRGKHRGWQVVERPLFAGYLFTQLDRDVDPWGEVERLNGVTGFVKQGGAPLRVPDVLIDELKAQEPYNFEQPLRAQALIGLKLGDQVRIVDGSFTGLFAELTQIDSRGRIAVLLSLFGRLCKLELETDQVERA